MGDTTDIGWCHRTFNPWIGCSRVSPACAGCYAADQTKRWRGIDAGRALWKRGGPRQVTSAAYWQKPLRWEKEAIEGSPEILVFSASLADVFEVRPDLDDPRARLFDLIGQTPHLRWLLLTKRIDDVPDLVPWGDDWPVNVWLGTSVESQRYTERAETLARIPAKVRFLSVEPLIEPVRLPLDGIHWVILGGMSGSKWQRHQLQVSWARSVRDQCLQADAGGGADGHVAFFFKQWGGLHAKDGGKVLDDREWCEFPADPALMAA